jgi:5-methylcytosine-specific restriction endonuclease McrA
MKPVSNKRQSRNREAKPIRDKFAADHPNCMVCGRPADDTHEIARGPARRKAQDKPFALLRLCRECHDDVHAKWSLGQQYALKALMDNGNYDRVALNRLRCREDDAISEREVWMEVAVVLRRIRYT